MATRDKVIEAIRGFDFFGYDIDPTMAAWVPDLADRICAAIDDQPFHVLDVGEQGWTLKHPLDCRDELFECPYNRAAEALEGPPAAPGRYRVGITEGRDYLLLGEQVTT